MPPQQKPLPAIGADVTDLMPIGADVTDLMGGGQSQTVGPTKPAGVSGGYGTLATIGDFVLGGVKGAAKTGLGLLDVGAKMALGSNPAAKPFAQARTALQPTNTAQSMGHGAEQVAEFFVPAAKVAKAKTALQTGRKVLDTLVGMGLEGASGAAVQTAQTGSTEGALATGLTGGMIAGASAAVPGGLKFLGERIERSLIKASKADVEHGFKVENVFRHGLGGTLSQSFDKANTKLATLGSQLKTELSRPNAAGVLPEVDVLGALADTAKELAANQTKTFGQNVKIQAAIENLLNDPVFETVAATGKVDIAKANELKQALGEMGAWLHGARDPDSTAMERVANTLYSKLRAAIEQHAVAGPERIKSLNRQMGEIIPIRTAIIRRIPVEQRQNVLNMGDLIGFGTGTIGLALANRVLRAGQTAQAAHSLGTAIQPLARPAATAATGLASQVIR